MERVVERRHCVERVLDPPLVRTGFAREGLDDVRGHGDLQLYTRRVVPKSVARVRLYFA